MGLRQWRARCHCLPPYWFSCVTSVLLVLETSVCCVWCTSLRRGIPPWSTHDTSGCPFITCMRVRLKTTERRVPLGGREEGRDSTGVVYSRRQSISLPQGLAKRLKTQSKASILMFTNVWLAPCAWDSGLGASDNQTHCLTTELAHPAKTVLFNGSGQSTGCARTCVTCYQRQTQRRRGGSR